MDPKRIEQLRDPSVFPGAAETVDLIQTHLSVVCVVGDFAYKFKKAIELPFVDFSSLENRKRFCEEELRLNRRLCPSEYLSVEKLRESPEGKIALGAESGEIIDYAVKMRRLPADRMMDVLLEDDAVSEKDIVDLAKEVVAFHNHADRGQEIDSFGDPEKLAQFAIKNFEESEKYVDKILSASLHEELFAHTKRDFKKWMPILQERLREGKIVDGHGDLHARNICLTDPIAIYDCIEFEPAFRCGDVALEHAFLLMDLRFRGHPELAKAYLEAVKAETGDGELKNILPLFMQYRAMVRCKVSAITASEQEVDPETRDNAKSEARRYMRLAAGLVVEERRPIWIMLCGLPGSGKSTIAGIFAEELGWNIFSSDRIRKELAGFTPTDRLPEEFYSSEFSNRTYREMIERATGSSSGISILDANYRTAVERAKVKLAAAEARASLVIIHLSPGDEELQRRLVERSEDPESVSDADVEVLGKLASQFEAPHPDECDLLLEASSLGSPETAAEEILSQMCRGIE